jgi:hypothetical protein
MLHTPKIKVATIVQKALALKKGENGIFLTDMTILGRQSLSGQTKHARAPRGVSQCPILIKTFGTSQRALSFCCEVFNPVACNTSTASTSQSGRPALWHAYRTSLKGSFGCGEILTYNRTVTLFSFLIMYSVCLLCRERSG